MRRTGHLKPYVVSRCHTYISICEVLFPPNPYHSWPFRSVVQSPVFQPADSRCCHIPISTLWEPQPSTRVCTNHQKGACNLEFEIGGLAYTRYCLVSGLCARMNTIRFALTLCLGTPHYPVIARTIAQYNICPRPPVIAIYTTQYWQLQYLVKANGWGCTTDKLVVDKFPVWMLPLGSQSHVRISSLCVCARVPFVL